MPLQRAAPAFAPGWGFLSDNATVGAIGLLAVLFGAALAWAEWRRPDRNRRLARVAAVLAAVGSLALLALRPGVSQPFHPPDHSLPEAALWTGGPRPAGEPEILRNVPADRQFRLPGADAPPGTPTVPDAAALRRHVPRVGRLHLLGDGLEAGECAALAGWRVAFHPGPNDADPAATPRFDFVQAPRTLAPGEPWWVTGRVGGTAPPGEALTVAWEEPTDPATPTTAPVAADGSFRLRGPGFPAPGRFPWKLRLVGVGERVREAAAGGVSVVAPDLPRTLVLEGSPHGDTAAVRRWLADAGGEVTTRTEVGRGRFRFTSTSAPADDGDGAKGFERVDAALLARLDLVLVDARALAGLSVPERGELRRAVADRGLGVLVRGDVPATSLPPDGWTDGEWNFFLPWRLERIPVDGTEAVPNAAGLDRAVRLRWTDRAGGETAPEEPVPVQPHALGGPSPGPGGEEPPVVLVRDGQDRAVAGRVARGRGQVGVSLVADTARWRRVGEPEVFAAFWTSLLGELTAPSVAVATTTGRWSLAGEAASGPVGARVDGPVELRWQGGTVSPESGVVTAEDAPAQEAPVTLPLAQDEVEPTRRHARFWPRHAGWHRVRVPPDGPALDFHVASADAWPGVRAAERRRATARFVALAAEAPSPSREASVGRPLTDSGAAATALFLVFVGAAGFLWAEGRREVPYP